MRFTEALEYQHFTLKPSGIYVSNHHPQSPFLSSSLNLKMATSVPTEILSLTSLLLFSAGASNMCDQRRGCVPKPLLPGSGRLYPGHTNSPLQSSPCVSCSRLHVVLITSAILVPCRWPRDFQGISQHKSKEDICETVIYDISEAAYLYTMFLTVCIMTDKK